MEQIEDKKQFAVLIDSDNISARYAASIFNEIENYGYASFRRIYGNWSGKSNGWKEQVLLENHAGSAVCLYYRQKLHRYGYGHRRHGHPVFGEGGRLLPGDQRQ